ncbi:MAG: aminotransferase class V-fold PLP-dependent enzyme [Planctomycetes bacterium]|nr:aminotransferase class V-fold PLP-dependent enzyme [Planctomycetota bacterium]
MLETHVAFTPGPVHVRADVLAAMARPPLPHRSDAFRAVVRRVQSGLAQMLATRAPVIPVLCSATTAFEIALAAVARRRVLALVNGSFGRRWADMAPALGFATERLEFAPGEPVDPDAVGRALAAGGFDAVAFVHSETSTGALSDLAAVAAACRARGAALVADAVSSLGALAIDFDSLGPDAVLVGSTGKGIACPPGMAVLAVGPGAAARARESTFPSHALRLETLLSHHAKGETPQTPATSLFHALDVQLAHLLAEGMAAREARHREMAALAGAWAEERFAVLPRPGFRSPAVTVIENTRALDVPRLLAAVERRGFRIADGHGPLSGATFRIGHLGDVTPSELARLLPALDEAIAEVS